MKNPIRFFVKEAFEINGKGTIVLGEINGIVQSSDVLYCDGDVLYIRKVECRGDYNPQPNQIVGLWTPLVADKFHSNQCWSSIKGINPDTIDPKDLRVTSGEHKFTPRMAFGTDELFGILWCHPAYKEHKVDPNATSQCGDPTFHCESMLSLDPGNHRVESLNPLTLYPSLVCRNCDEHGWLEKGNYKASNFTYFVPPNVKKAKEEKDDSDWEYFWEAGIVG